MARVCLLLCFTMLIASVTLLEVVSAHLNIPTGSPSGASGSGSFGATESGSGSKSVFKDTTGALSPMSSPSSSSSFGASGSGSGASFKDTSGSKSTSSRESETSIGGTTKTTSKNNAIAVTKVEADTSKEVMKFLMNLEKKCPPKEEYKAFFEQLKVTMTISVSSSKASPKARRGFFSRIKAGVGKISDAMAFVRSRIASKSAEVKKSLETYQEEVMEAVQQLETIHSQIIAMNKGKAEGKMTCTAAQQKEIQVTITKWEKVTTQFVETAIQSESSSSSSSSSSMGKATLN